MFGYSIEELTLVVAALSLLLNVALLLRHFRRARNASEQILQLQDEVQTYRQDFTTANDRLNEVDPTRFLATFEELEAGGDFNALQKAATEFFSEHNYAIAEAARALAEAAIMDFNNRGISALDEAESLVKTGLNALPDDRRLAALSTEIGQRRTAAAEGDDYEFLPPENVGASALNRISLKFYNEKSYALAEMLARHTVPKVILEYGRNSANFARAAFHHAVTLRSLGRTADAEEAGRVALDAAEEVWGEDHVEYARILEGYSLFKFAAGGSMDDYLSMMEKALVVFKEKLGDDDPKTVALTEIIDWTRAGNV